ncbi:hypothetical protein KUTeg_000905 [Tegillarca granosa]|uniref:Uncharacterized protein n=1 Tax=Tegillarca granosa TaxID=220873 RepID=A0ABQ9FWA7_TEGGR|nr:hypothetical protein KUTeg_000905 [Tegillarca granosa]
MDDINAEKKDDERKKQKAPKTKTKPNKNKDGLIYADILHEGKPTGERKLVIHGSENKTDYADVDFSRSGKPPAPDNSQTDKQKPANK